MKRHLHLGLGRFHRAHQALYLQEQDTRITAFSMRSPTEAESLRRHGHRYEVLILSRHGTEKKTVDCIDEALFVQDHRRRLFELIADPEIRTLTLTITEKGYCADNRAQLDLNCPALRADKDSPTSAPALLVEGLERRKERHAEPFHVLSCDNLSHNGDRLRSICSQWCSHFGKEEMLPYLETRVDFPNSMVDRIVPALSSEQLTDFAQRFKMDQENFVATEAFSQWVIEDRFSGDRPDWGPSGVTFVDQVAPYENMKLRLLNAAHSFLAYHGQLQGYQYVHTAIGDPVIREQVERLFFEEVGPLLSPPRGLSIDSYCGQLLDRFQNPHLPHKLAQIAMDGSQKLPQRILGSLRQARGSGGPHQVLSLALEAWLDYMWLGLSGGRELFISDPAREQMEQHLGRDRKESTRRWLQDVEVLGPGVAELL